MSTFVIQLVLIALVLCCAYPKEVFSLFKRLMKSDYAFLFICGGFFFMLFILLATPLILHETEVSLGTVVKESSVTCVKKEEVPGNKQYYMLKFSDGSHTILCKRDINDALYSVEKGDALKKIVYSSGKAIYNPVHD